MTTPHKTKIEQVDVREDVVVVDQNSEFSDMDNPQGYIYRRTFVVLAITKDGRRFAHHHFFGMDRDKADALAIKVLYRGEIDHSYWKETYPVYGSSAWEVEEVYRQVDLAAAVGRGDWDEAGNLA
jgi:hypothetical protein